MADCSSEAEGATSSSVDPTPQPLAKANVVREEMASTTEAIEQRRVTVVFSWGVAPFEFDRPLRRNDAKPRPTRKG
jgi:hypothetical protein